MLIPIAVGAALVAVTVTLHLLGTAWWVQRLRAHAARPSAGSGPHALRVLLHTALVLLGLHLVEVLLWALVYRFNPSVGITSLEEAIYFSLVTFTTLGYGDITIAPPWRVLGGIEALNGILLLGWSTAVSFAVVQSILGERLRESDR